MYERKREGGSGGQGRERCVRERGGWRGGESVVYERERKRERMREREREREREGERERETQRERARKGERERARAREEACWSKARQ